MTLSLVATNRELTGKKVKQLRAKKQLPAVVYGSELKAKPITIDLGEFKRVYKEAGTSALVDLAVEGDKPVKVLVHEPQSHHLTGEPLHVDLYAVKMTQKIETAIPIHFVGTSLAVEELEGNFIANKDELNIRCLPADLIPSIELDISVLKTFDDQIRVEDIKVPQTVEVLDEREDVVALVTAPRTEEEMEAELAEDKVAEEAAVEELGKEETVEGETPAEGETLAEGKPVAETEKLEKS